MSGHIFRQFRERHGLTQSELGIALGVEPETSQARISHYESARREVPRDVAYRFLDLAAERGEAYTLEDVLPRPIAHPTPESSEAA